MAEETQEIELKTPVASGRVRGTDTIAAVMFALGGAGLVMLWYHDQGAQARDLSLRTEIRESSKDTAAAVTKVANSYEELAYMMSLTPEARARLNLEMPESMRRRLRDR